MGVVLQYYSRRERELFAQVPTDMQGHSIRALAAEVSIPTADVLFDDNLITVRGVPVRVIRNRFPDDEFRDVRERVLERVLFFKRVGFIRDIDSREQKVLLAEELMRKTYESARLRDDEGMIDIVEEMWIGLLRGAALQ